MNRTRIIVIAVALAGALATGCGAADQDAADVPGSTAAASNQGGSGGGGDHAQHRGSSGANTQDTTKDAPADDMEGMVTLATVEEGDVEVQLHAMPPELFFVSEGDRQREQRPAKTDDAHLMVTLADRESSVRLPDATVVARVRDSKGATVFEGPLYPMVGRGMGLHYGENVTLGDPGKYDIELTIGPPRVGRHRAVENAWSQTRKIRQSAQFDGKTLEPA